MMKRIYTVLLSVGVVACAVAQTKTAQPHARIGMKPTLDEAVPVGPAQSGARSQVLWEDDFSDAATWTVGHDGAIALDWQIGVGLTNSGDFPTAPVNSPSQANGYAMLDSDGFNNNTGTIEQSHMTTVNSISTVGYDNVVLEFQTFYRKWTNENIYVVISTNNTDWTPLTTTNPGTPGVYEVFPGMAVQEVIDNPTRVRINISDVAGNQPEIWVRFYWAGEWGYSWFVDDVKVIEQPAYELIMEDGFLSQTGDGEEYGRIPSQHLEPTMLVGGNFLNFGVNPMTNVLVSLDVTGPDPFSANSSATDLASAAGGLMSQEENLPNGGALSNGLYEGTFTLTSDEASQEEDLDNNVYLRNFEVTPDWYTVDGIGNHPAGYQSLGSLGTNTFEDAADGLIVFNYYPMRVQQTVYGIELGITSTSQAGSYFIAAIWDTTLDATTNLPAPLFSTDIIDVTDGHIADGKITVAFDAPQTLQPGGYFVGVTMYSNAGASILRVVDDLTVPQPGLTSGIQIPNDQVYSNGNAFHIRLATTNVVSVPERDELTGVTIGPNPVTTGTLFISTAKPGTYNVEVLDVLGQRVLSARSGGSFTVDLSGQPAGAYLVRVSDGQDSLVRRVVKQ